ncbi:hypothetical protein ABFT80_27005 [Mesorhizobium sp. SB112]|uniref:hypothetical protein n=1 Tax=Mesorhizobium sp. SB112 TaxID=3151853 RepID=UPI0032640C2C
MNRLFYMITGALTALVQHALQEAEKVVANPAALEVLSVAVRKGLETPDKVAFAHRSTMIRSRVVMHRSYANRSASSVQVILPRMELVLHRPVAMAEKWPECRRAKKRDTILLRSGDGGGYFVVAWPISWRSGSFAPN